MPTLNPTLHTTAVAALEAALNRALSLDPAIQNRLKPLAGKVFQLYCTRPEFDIFLQPQGAGIRLMGYWDAEVSTSIRGTASDFAELATSADPAAALINGALEIRGDSSALIELQKIIASLDMDWEAPLVDNLGDVAGHQLAGGLRGLFSWGRLASGSLSRQLEEFIHEEARLSPPRLEFENFCQDVEHLGLRVDRLRARINKLQKSRAGTGN